MPDPNPSALEFLLSRRSRPAKTLAPPVPTRDQLGPILTAAARSPDHGKLEPWRFVVIDQNAMVRLANLAESRARASCMANSMSGFVRFSWPTDRAECLLYPALIAA